MMPSSANAGFLAAIYMPGESPSVRTNLFFGDILLIVAVTVILLSILIGWAMYIREPKRGRKRRAHHGRKVFREKPAMPVPANLPAGNEEGEEEAGGLSRKDRRRFKYRAKRRNHRGRNPTLAETGGLPPPASSQEDART